MWIYLSPHLDDAIYSCGGLISSQVAAGEEVAVWTVFAGDPPQDGLSPFARHLHEVWNLAEPSFAARRNEDEEACALLGASCRHFHNHDAMYRRCSSSGQHLYPGHTEVFGKLARGDQAFAAALSVTLSRELPPDATLVVPLGAGNHVDHMLTRLMAESLGRPLLYFEDLPYAADQSTSLYHLLETAWSCELRSLAALDMDAWERAAAAYASQLELCWTSKTALRAALNAQLSDANEYRLWRRTAPSQRPMLSAEQLDATDPARSILLIPHQFVPISPGAASGGGVASIVDLAEALARAGCRVTVGACLSEAQDLQWRGVYYHHFKAGRTIAQNLSAVSDRGFTTVIGVRLDALDIASAYFPFALKVLRVVDVLWDAHQRPVSAANEIADVVVPVSAFVHRELVAHGVAAAKIKTIREAVHRKRFNRQPAIARDPRLLVFAGATLRAKGLDILLEAVFSLLQRGLDFRLEVYGSVHLWSASNEAFDWNRIGENWPSVVYKGDLDPDGLAGVFNRAALCVFPSNPTQIAEGALRVCIEAQACGCPVITTASGGAPEAIVDGETGLVVDPLNRANLAEAIAALLQDPARLAAMSQAAEVRGLSFGIDDAANELLQLLRALR